MEHDTFIRPVPSTTHWFHGKVNLASARWTIWWSHSHSRQLHHRSVWSTPRKNRYHPLYCGVVGGHCKSLIKGLLLDHCPKWFSSVIYICNGLALCVCLCTHCESIVTAGFGWLWQVIIYTGGRIIYASFKLPISIQNYKISVPWDFPLFVMGSSLCHFIVMYFFVLPMPV